MYRYEDERPKLFTESGVETLSKVRDAARRHLAEAGAFAAGKVVHGDSWLTLAALDYLAERGEIREVTRPDAVWGQDRVFVGPQPHR